MSDNAYTGSPQHFPPQELGGETQATIAEFFDPHKFGMHANDPTDAETLAIKAITLHMVATHLGLDLRYEINRKMAKLRHRKAKRPEA